MTRLPKTQLAKCGPKRPDRCRPGRLGLTDVDLPKETWANASLPESELIKNEVFFKILYRKVDTIFTAPTAQPRLCVYVE